MGIPYVRVGWLAMITSAQHPKYNLLCKILRHTWNLSTISDQNQGPGDLIDIGGRGAKICYPSCFYIVCFDFSLIFLGRTRFGYKICQIGWLIPTISNDQKRSKSRLQTKFPSARPLKCRGLQNFCPDPRLPNMALVTLAWWKKRSDTFHWNPGSLIGMFILIPTWYNPLYTLKNQGIFRCSFVCELWLLLRKIHVKNGEKLGLEQCPPKKKTVRLRLHTCTWWN